VSLLKSHGQRRESVLCGEGLAGSTRQQEPKDIKKRRIKQTIRRNGGMKNKAIQYGRKKSRHRQKNVRNFADL
jgi:hypothetical protein